MLMMYAIIYVGCLLALLISLILLCADAIKQSRNVFAKAWYLFLIAFALLFTSSLFIS